MKTICYFLLGLFLARSSFAQDEKPAGAELPNILIILADDMGFSDLGSYGSEINTPNLDRMAKAGIQFTNFHVGAACSPTRTMLMTGVDNHLAGLGNMLEIIADNQRGKPGYEGHLNDKVVTVSTLLKDAGYHTYMAGKWHLGKDKVNIPHGRGFDRSFTLLESGADNWVNQSYEPMYKKVHYYEDDKEVDLPEENYFSTNHYTDKMLAYIKSNKDSGKPFFGYLAYQAVHSPHQAPLVDVNRYNGTYDAGWELTRQKRLARQKELGLFGADAILAPDFDKATMFTVPDWKAASEEEKKFHARRMQVYAGMVDNMDQNIGRILGYLKKNAQLENTLIIFLSDNGADPTELQDMEAFKPWYAAKYKHTYAGDMKPDFTELGQKGSFSAYGPGWAGASNSPTSYWKTFSAEGGLRVPCIAYWPGKIPADRKTAAFGYVSDIVPTLLDVAGVDRPGSSYKGSEIYPPSGESMWPLLSGASSRIHPTGKSIGYELAGSSAIFRDNYKLVREPAPKGTGTWELYDFVKDPAEVHDLAAKHPELVASLKKAYEKYEEDNKIIPVPTGYNPAAQLQKNAALNSAQ